jgi:hypothetical protein
MTYLCLKMERSQQVQVQVVDEGDEEEARILPQYRKNLEVV